MYIFSMENPFFRFVGRVVDLVWLNILTLICCIPVVTAGAAISGMYKVLLSIVFGEEGTITSGFFKAFRANLKSATKVWVPSLLVFVVLLSNAYLIYQGVMDQMAPIRTIAGICIGIIGTILLVYLQYVFALISRYDAELKQTCKNAILLEAAFFPRSLCILAILFFPMALMMLSNYFFWLWFLYGLTIPGYFIAMLLEHIFVKTVSIQKEDENRVNE